MSMISICTLLLFLYGTAEAGFTEQPSDTSVIQGETAILKCTVVMNSNSAVLSWLYWSKGNKHLSINDTILPDMGDDVRSRYSITGNRSNGEYYLRIVDAKKFDEGSFHCSYISNTGGETSISASLTVFVPPDHGYPKCEAHPSSDVGIDSTTVWPGQGVVFSCLSNGGDPPAQLSWHRGNHSILEPRTGRITYERILKREDNGITFTCRATSPALPTPRTCSVTPMKILPVVQVRSMSGRIKEGENATFHCEGSAIPRVYKYTWFAFSEDTPIENDHRFSISNHNQVLTIHDVDYSENRLEIRCEVRIKTGLKSSASIRLEVAEPPKITKPPAIEKKSDDNDGHRTITDITKIISMDVNFAVAIIAGSLVLLLLVVAIIMGCWVCGTTKPRRSTTLPRVEYTETVPTTIPKSYSMDALNYHGHMVYGDTSCAEPATTALENENAPGYISALYATLDKNKRPVRTAVAINIPGKPIAQVTPSSQSCANGEGTSSGSCCTVKPVKVAPEPVKISPLVGKVAAVEPVKPLVKPTAKAEAGAIVKPAANPPVKPVKLPEKAPVKPVVKLPEKAPVKPVVKLPEKAPVKPVVKLQEKAKPSGNPFTPNAPSGNPFSADAASTSSQERNSNGISDSSSDDGTDVDHTNKDTTTKKDTKKP